MKKDDIYDEGECWFDDPLRYGKPDEDMYFLPFAVICVVAYFIMAITLL